MDSPPPRWRGSVAEPLPGIVVLGDLDDHRNRAATSAAAATMRVGLCRPMRGVERVGPIGPAVPGIPQLVKAVHSPIQSIERVRREAIHPVPSLNSTDGESMSHEDTEVA